MRFKVLTEARMKMPEVWPKDEPGSSRLFAFDNMPGSCDHCSLAGVEMSVSPCVYAAC